MILRKQLVVVRPSDGDYQGRQEPPDFIPGGSVGQVRLYPEPNMHFNDSLYKIDSKGTFDFTVRAVDFDGKILSSHLKLSIQI